MSQTPAHDAKDAATLREITAQIRQLRGEAAGVLYQLGQLLLRVAEGELWRAGGHSSFTDYLEQAADVSPTTARRCVIVARHFNLEIVQRYGFDKLHKGLRYMELTRKIEAPGDLIAAKLRNRGPDGRFFTVPFHEATSRQVEDAIQIEIDLLRISARQAPADVAGRLSALEASLPAVPGGVRPAKRRVDTSQASGGELLLTFKQIPLSELRSFLAAVERELLGEVEG